MRDLFYSLGAKTISLGRSGNFLPIDTEAVRREDVDQAKPWAENLSFDLLISTDGDADRPLIADEQEVPEGVSCWYFDCEIFRAKSCGYSDK